VCLVFLILLLNFVNYFLIMVFKWRDDHAQLVLDMVQICILSCFFLVSLCMDLLLIIIRKTVLETSLNDFYTYLDLHLSIQLTMCLMHPMYHVSLSTA